MNCGYLQVTHGSGRLVWTETVPIPCNVPIRKWEDPAQWAWTDPARRVARHDDGFLVLTSRDTMTVSQRATVVQAVNTFGTDPVLSGVGVRGRWTAADLAGLAAARDIVAGAQVVLVGTLQAG